MSSSAQRRALLRASPIVFAIAAIAAHAEPAANKLDEVIVTATRNPQKVADVLADVTVLNRDEIERQAFGTLADLLRRQVGFEMIRNGGPGANTSMFIRGAETRHAAVLIDGVRVDSQASSGVSWNAIPLAQIDRVEIVRGPASALYGSDAIGGVVQIFTRKGEGKPVVELGIGGGNRGLVKADASVAGKTGIVDYALGITRESSNGFNSRPTSDKDLDGYVSRNASLRLGAQLSKQHRLELSALTNHVDAEFDPFTITNDDRTISDTRTKRAAWSAQWSTDLRSDLSIGESMERYEIPPPGSIYQTETRVRTYTATGSVKLGAAGELQGVLERREDRLENNGLYQSPVPNAGKRNQNALGAGWLWSAGALSLQLNGRHDDDSVYGKVNTGSLAAGWKLGPAWRVQGSYGNSFRAPSIYQRYSQYGVATLRPERGLNAELGLHFVQGRSEFGLTAYRNKVRDLIVFSSFVNRPLPCQEYAPGSTFRNTSCYENVAKGLLQGLSLRGATELAGIRLSATLDLQSPKYIDPTVVTTYGKQLPRRAKTHGVMRAETDVGALTVGAQILASGQRWDNQANTAKLGGYATLDVDAQYAFSRQLSLQFKAENLTDKQYVTAGGYSTAPRQLFIGLRVTPQL